jgi:hypothetical protein
MDSQHDQDKGCIFMQNAIPDINPTKKLWKAGCKSGWLQASNNAQAIIVVL